MQSLTRARSQKISLPWLLVFLWLGLNIFDIAVSWVAVQLGANEVGIIWRITRSWPGLIIWKMLLALFVGCLLMRFRKDTWLIWLNAGFLGICVYNSWVLFRQING
jgi:hypothetical protein